MINLFYSSDQVNYIKHARSEFVEYNANIYYMIGSGCIPDHVMMVYLANIGLTCTSFDPGVYL